MSGKHRGRSKDRSRRSAVTVAGVLAAASAAASLTSGSVSAFAAGPSGPSSDQWQSDVSSGCSGPCAPPPCPQGTSIHVRWHYSANGSSGSWSATTSFTCPSSISMGPQAMEGNLKVAPGDTLKAGYDFTIPGNNNMVNVTFTDAQVTFSNVKCVSGASPMVSTISVPMASPQSYASTNGASWYPSGDQHSDAVYQGSIGVPDVCGGGLVSLQKGGTFTAEIS